MSARSIRTSIVTLVGLLGLATQRAPLRAQVSQGFKFPTVVDFPNMFVFPENAFLKEGTCAGPAGPGGNCAGVPQGTLGDYAGFGFTIPIQALILGIEVMVGGEGGELPDAPVLALLDPQGEPVGQAKSVSMPAFTYHEEVAGSPNDTWGFSWTPVAINAAGFGVRVADVDVPGGFRLDYVAIRVHYAPKRPAIVQRPRYSVAPAGPSDCDPADILVQPGSGLSPCGAPGSPEVLIPCAALTFSESCTGPLGAGPPLNDDVTALTFGHEIGAAQLFFSVSPLAQGCPGTAVEDHHVAGHPQGDEFEVSPDPVGSTCNTNTVFYTAAELGLEEETGGAVDDDDLDALAWPGMQAYFTLAPDSPTLAILGAASSDILTTPVPGEGPEVAMSHEALGLAVDDVIDALCMGSPGSGEVVFSLAPGSPSLLATGLSPGDLLVPGPALLAPAASLGLLGEDDLDAVKCALDCNANGLVDSDEVAQGTAQDSNSDGLLDECESPPPPDFSACGTLVAMGECLFLELAPGGIYYVQNLGGFQAGAQVLVEGALDPSCAAIVDLTCPVPAVLAGCIVANTIEPCVPAEFTACGALVAFAGCVLFLTANSEYYQIQDIGAFGPGDFVEITGSLVEGCPSTCAMGVPSTVACIVPAAITPCAPPLPIFHRGDANGDGGLEISDAILILVFLFAGGPAPDCLDAADAQDNGVLELTDGVRILSYLFLGSLPPDPPGPPSLPCGEDPTADKLGCESYPNC